jgi:hypothetical protein
VSAVHGQGQGQGTLRGTRHTAHAVQVPQSSLVEDSKLLERMLRQVHKRKSVVQHATCNMQHAAEGALLERTVRQASALCCAAARQAHATSQ